MSHRQAYLASTSEGILGGAFVVVGFVVLVVVTAVDMITSRWSPVPSTQVKEDSGSKPASVIPLSQANDPSSPDIVKDSTKDPKPLSDIGTMGDTQDASEAALSPEVTAPAEQSEDQTNNPPTRDPDDESSVKVEESRAEDSVPQDLGQIEISETNDSSQEWISLSKPDVPLSPIQEGDVQSEEPSAPLEHETSQAEASSYQQEEPPLEFSSATLIDAPTKLETATIIQSDTSSLPPSTPEPEAHSFDAAVRIQTDAEKQAPLNPSSDTEFGAVSDQLVKARTSTPSLRSASGSISRGGVNVHSEKKKRGGSFMRRSSTLMTKVFKTKEGSSDVNGNLSSSIDSSALASSLVSEPESQDHSTSGPDVSASTDSPSKKLTSPSRVSLGSIRSISGSIKKKMGKGSDKDVPAADRESHSVTSEPSGSSQPGTSKVAADAVSGPSLLKTMFKVRKTSEK